MIEVQTLTPFPKTIAELSPRLHKKEISPMEVTQACLDRIEKLNPSLNAFITVTADAALASAKEAQAEILAGQWRGPLHGVPIAVKDLIDVAGVRTTAGSALYADRIPTEDAEVVRRLKEAGAIIVGKNNLHEFAYGGSSVVSHFGEVHNPRGLTRIAGGSSGGSAAAVAAGLCYGAIGTDTAGSIREPAALCGCAGLKPTYGRVSARGVIPLAWSLDHVGPLAGSVEDAALLLQAIAGYDDGDVTSARVPVTDYSSFLSSPASVSTSSVLPGESTKRLRVGVPRRYFFEELDSEIAGALEQALKVVQSLVAEVKEVELEVPGDRTLQAAESYAFHREHVVKSPELYQPETLRRILSGSAVTAADYIQRRRELESARRNICAVFAHVDLLITPTTPIPAPAIVELKNNPDRLRPAELSLLRNTRPFNVWGLPAISIPCGFTKAKLPIGMQIAGAHWREDLVLGLAHAYERATVSS